MTKKDGISFIFDGRKVETPEKLHQLWTDRFDKVVDSYKKDMQDVVRKNLNEVVDNLKRRHGNPYPAGTSLTSLSSRTGKGINSLKPVVKKEKNGYIGRITGLDRILFHEFGGIIRAKSGYLTIPLDAARKADGSPRTASSRVYKDTFVKKSKAGNLIIFQRKGNTIVPLYVLKRQVRVPARLGANREIEKQIPKMAEDIREMFVDAYIRGKRKKRK